MGENGSLKPTHARFGVLGFACSLSLLTYLDRICIMRVQESIRADLEITQVAMGLVFGAFAVGYALFEVPGGWMGDAWGTRKVIVRIVLWWTTFTALTGCIWKFEWDSGRRLNLAGWEIPLLFDSLVLMILVRFLFGCGEAGAYPNLARVGGAWFPFRERGLVLGAIWMSGRLGGAIAPVTIGLLTVWLGWRQAFWVLGAVGAVWCVFFYLWFRNTPEEKPECNAAERELIRAGPYSWKAAQSGGQHAFPPWRELLWNSNVWAMCVASFCVSFGWYFYPTWQPQYLKDVHGFEFRDSEILTGLPFFCGAIGSLLGGGLSDWLVGRLGSRRWGRAVVGLVGFTGAGVCVLLTGFVAEWWQAVTLLCLAFFINDIAIPPIWAVATDIGGRFAATLAGFMNMMGAFAAVLCPIMIPVLLGSVPEDYPPRLKWTIIFSILAGSWFIAALTWFRIDAGTPVFSEPDPAGSLRSPAGLDTDSPISPIH